MLPRYSSKTRNRLDKYIFSRPKEWFIQLQYSVLVTRIFFKCILYSYLFYLGISRKLRGPLSFNQSRSLLTVLRSFSRTACLTIFQSSSLATSTRFFNSPHPKYALVRFPLCPTYPFQPHVPKAFLYRLQPTFRIYMSLPITF